MSTKIINIKVDSATKREAQKIAKQLGFSLSGILKSYLQEFIRTKRVQRSLKEEPSDRLIASIEQAEQEYKEGRTISFSNPKEELAYLDRLIAKNERTRGKN